MASSTTLKKTRKTFDWKKLRGILQSDEIAKAIYPFSIDQVGLVRSRGETKQWHFAIVQKVSRE